jgi:hypothetical protein
VAHPIDTPVTLARAGKRFTQAGEPEATADGHSVVKQGVGDVDEHLKPWELRVSNRRPATTGRLRVVAFWMNQAALGGWCLSRAGSYVDCI